MEEADNIPNVDTSFKQQRASIVKVEFVDHTSFKVKSLQSNQKLSKNYFVDNHYISELCIQIILRNNVLIGPIPI